MTPFVQELLTYAAVLVAAGWLVVELRRRRARGRCEGCSPRSTAARTRDHAIRSPGLRVLP